MVMVVVRVQEWRSGESARPLVLFVLGKHLNAQVKVKKKKKMLTVRIRQLNGKRNRVRK